MKEKEKKSNSKNYLVQGSILAVASIIAKISQYDLPLPRLTLGNENSYYSTANEGVQHRFDDFLFQSLPLAVSSSFPSGFIRENLKMRTEFFCARCVLH